MATGDKLVTLDGLKAVYDVIDDDISDVKSNLYNIANTAISNGVSTSTVEYGGINGGVDVSNTSRARTDGYLPIFGGNAILTLPSGYSAHIVGYDINKTYVSDFGGWNTNGATITATGCSYIRFVFKNSAGSTLTDSDIITLSGFYITETPLMYEGLKVHDETEDLKTKAQIYIIRPNTAYIEQTNMTSGSIYLHFDGNIAVRVIANVTKSISDLATELGVSLVTSTKGVANCVEIQNEKCLVFNTSTSTFSFVARTALTNTMIIVLSCVNGRAVNLLPSLISDEIYNLTNDVVNLGAELGSDYIQDSVTAVLNNMASQNGNCLNLAFITDLHFNAFGDDVSEQTEIWRRNSNGLTAVNKKRNIDFTILGGDYLWNNANSTLARANNAYRELQKVFFPHGNRLFALKGNHDDNSIANDESKIITDSVRYGYLGQQYTNDVKINYCNAEKSYGFIDFKRQKVRTLFINTVDIPSYTGQHITGVSNTQLNFFADALNITENGWAVIIFSHHLLVNNATMNPSHGAEGYLTPTHGGDALWGMIQAFKNKSTYSKVSTLTDYEYSVNVDYSNNGSSEVIACISGHTHRDLSATQDGVLLISTTASGFGQTKYDSEGNSITQTIDTKSETSFDVYSFDRINSTIKASRYGAGQNRNWTY